MFTTIAILATATCGAALVTGSRVFGLRKIVKHSTKADVAFTAGTAFVLAGTLTGLATAIVAGLMMALILSFLKVCYNLSDSMANGYRAVMTRNEADVSDDWEYNTGVHAPDTWMRS